MKVSVVKKDDVKSLVKLSFEQAVKIFAAEANPNIYIYSTYGKQDITRMLARSNDNDRIVTKDKAMSGAKMMEGFAHTFDAYLHHIENLPWFIIYRDKFNGSESTRAYSLFVKQPDNWIMVCQVEVSFFIRYDLINQFIATLHRLNPNVDYYKLKDAFLELMMES